MIWLKLLGVLNWLKKALAALFRLAVAYPREAAIVALLCLSGWLWWHLGDEQDGRASDRLAYAAEIKRRDVASKEARAKQIALNQTNQELSQRIAADATLRRDLRHLHGDAPHHEAGAEAADHSQPFARASRKPSQTETAIQKAVAVVEKT